MRVLVFHQLADRAHTTVAEVVDVVDFRPCRRRRSTSVLMTDRMSSLRSCAAWCPVASEFEDAYSSSRDRRPTGS